MTAIPRLRVEGSHREVGRQVGAATAGTLREAVAFDGVLPAGRSRDEQLALATRYRDATLAATPWLVEEIDGAAEGAGVDPIALFAASIEEIWSVRPSQATAGVVVDGRCSDLVAGPPATADGHCGSATPTTCRRRRVTTWSPSNGTCPVSRSCSRWASGRGSASAGTRRGCR